MTDTLLPSAGLPSHASERHLENEERGIFAFIMAALHASRQLQARRVLRRYDHLIAGAQERIRHELKQISEGSENARH